MPTPYPQEGHCAVFKNAKPQGGNFTVDFTVSQSVSRGLHQAVPGASVFPISESFSAGQSPCIVYFNIPPENSTSGLKPTYLVPHPHFWGEKMD